MTPRYELRVSGPNGEGDIIASDNAAHDGTWRGVTAAFQDALACYERPDDRKRSRWPLTHRVVRI